MNLAYIAEQLGHADASVTARSYARWIGSGSYRSPLEVHPGEVPADLLARLDSGRGMKTANGGMKVRARRGTSEKHKR